MSSKVLVIDDNERDAGLLCRAISGELGLECHTATSLASGLRFDTEDVFDLVILDLLLGEKPKDQPEQTLKSVRAFRGGKVIAFSGVDDADLRSQAKAAGCVDFLQKGTPTEGLLERVANALEMDEPDPDMSRRVFNVRRRKIQQDQNWLRRNASAVAVCFTIISAAAGMVWGWHNSGMSDARTTASEKATVTMQLDQLRKADVDFADAMKEVLKELKGLQTADTDSKNDRARIHSDIGRVTSEIGAMRAEFGLAQRRFERNQIRMMIKMGVQPADDRPDE